MPKVLKPIFVGRNEKIAQLNSLLKKKTASIVVIKGRRRIGKSRLVAEFTRDKSLIKFVGLPPEKKLTAQLQREHFAYGLHKQFSICSKSDFNPTM